MLPALLILTPLLFSPAAAEEFSASFKGTDIQEFINTVSKNLNKTVIIDPSVRAVLSPCAVTICSMKNNIINSSSACWMYMASP
ncbi:hypothetical protein LNQ03_11660 [Klebsiella pneumoniae subsp. pneumoniae]|nr:hypothetical protein [Klebsiella pneumoniae subsp. pneumoniae]